MLGLLACAMVFQGSSAAWVATKTVQAVRRNDSKDSTLFYNGVMGVSGYTGIDLAPSGATEASFRSNTRTIKYWSSHGLNGGSEGGTPIVYGEGTGILRFSSLNPNGTAQTYSLNNPVTVSNGLIANTYLSAEHEIPNYALKATPREIEIDENVPVMVYRDENTVTVT